MSITTFSAWKWSGGKRLGNADGYRLMLLLIPRDRGLDAAGPVDLVQPAHDVVDNLRRELDGPAVTPGPQHPVGQIDAQPSRLGRPAEHRGDLVEHAGGQHQRGDPGTQAVPVEDRAEARGQQAPDTEIRERPRGMLPAGPATEVPPRRDDPGTPVARLVEHEVRVTAPVREQPVR